MRLTRYLLGALFVVHALAAPETSSPGCSVAGEVFSVDLWSGIIVVKNADGYLVPVKLNWDSVVLKAAQDSKRPWIDRVDPVNIQQGDFVCAHPSAIYNGITATLDFLPRSEIVKAQRKYLEQFQADTVFGPVVNVDMNDSTIQLRVEGNAEPVAIRVPPDAVLRRFPKEAVDPSSAVPITLGDIRAGELASVHGTFDPDTQESSARTVYTGGVRAVVGVILNTDALGSTIQLRELGTGITYTVSVSPSNLFRTLGPLDPNAGKDSTEAALGGNHRILRTEFSDLDPSDAVLALGRVHAASNEIAALAVISRFGYFADSTDTPYGPIDFWFLR
ncbi:MAG TPA: hypothetical protein VE621_14890 [Bryobacteraceae bacterium]|jgi:hypothetical protein|nr:hypothetical protein [Bryobacteraceae bacterium]